MLALLKLRHDKLDGEAETLVREIVKSGEGREMAEVIWRYAACVEAADAAEKKFLDVNGALSNMDDTQGYDDSCKKVAICEAWIMQAIDGVNDHHREDACLLGLSDQDEFFEL